MSVWTNRSTESVQPSSDSGHSALRYRFPHASVKSERSESGSIATFSRITFCSAEPAGNTRYSIRANWTGRLYRHRVRWVTARCTIHTLPSAKCLTISNLISIFNHAGSKQKPLPVFLTLSGGRSRRIGVSQKEERECRSFERFARGGFWTAEGTRRVRWRFLRTPSSAGRPCHPARRPAQIGRAH